MDIKKGLTYIAFGFLFTFVNINLKISGTTVNITPAFIGWTLLFLSFSELGDYVKGRQVIKWCFLLLAIEDAAEWGMQIIKPELTFPDTVSTAAAAAAAAVVFILFGILQKIADDYNSPRAETLGFLKYVNVILLAGVYLTAVSSAQEYLKGETVLAGYLALAMTGLSIAAIVSAVCTAAVLFRLKGEIG